MPKVIKPNDHCDVCWVSVLTTFLRATNFGCIDSFFCPIQKRREMMGDGFAWRLLLPVCFEQ